MKTTSLAPILSKIPPFLCSLLADSTLLLIAVLGLFVCQSTRALSPVPFYEPFPTNYTEGEALGGATSGAVWDTGNSATSSGAKIHAASALSYPGLVTTAGSSGLSSGTGTGKNRGATLATTGLSNVTMYASFLLNLQANAPGNRILSCMASTTGSGPNASVGVFINNQNQLQISKNSSTVTSGGATSPLVTNSTYLIVLRYKFNPGTSDDEADLWLNPTALGNDNNIPAPTLSTTNGSDSATAVIQAFYYMDPSSGSNTVFAFFMDEIRVATNWAGVTPASCNPTLYTVTGGGISCSGAAFDVGLSGSDLGVDYWVFTNAEFGGQVVSGTGSALDFGPQAVNASYSVLASNTTTMCVGFMNGTVTVADFTAPGIATQPAPVNVVNGYVAELTVGATGNELTYQWRLNGSNLVDGTHYSGSSSSTLTILSAGAGDAATSGNGYEVVVSGYCSPPVTSSRVGLTIVPATNLTWVGIGPQSPSNFWDIGITADWIDPGNNPTPFYNGDAVTINDSGNPPISIVDNNINPSSIFVQTGVGWAFAGAGRIVGPTTTLFMSGGGTLAISNANTFGGGMTISNGTISFTTAAALGSGPITFDNAGILDAPNLQGLTLGNAIDVEGSGTINIRNTSTSALILTNTLSGANGSLTLANYTSGRGPTVQLTAPGFTFDLPIIFDLTTSGTSGTNLFLEANNPSNTIVLNGIISGPGTVQRNGSGTLVLTATNTYSSATLLSNGSLGVGSDSVSSSPPTIDSGPLGAGPLIIDVGSGTPRLFASGGSHTVGNPIGYITNLLGSPLVITGSFALTLSGAFDLNATNRTIQADGSGAITFSGVISDGGFIKTGTNKLTLSAVNTYTGTTTVSNGTLLVNGQIDVGGVTVVSNAALGGTGTILGAVTVNAGGILAPGVGIGTLTINSNLTLAGKVAIDVNKSVSPSNDLTVVSGTLSNSGTGAVSVNNAGPALVSGDRFQIFNKAVSNGGAMTVTGGGAGVVWTNNLAVDGSISVLFIVVSHPSITTASLSGSNFILNGTNGPAGQNYFLLSSTNVAAPVSNWTHESTNAFDGTGHFSITNVVSPGVPQKFYLLQVSQ
jgi:autotransporter-associated beta strand protein